MTDSQRGKKFLFNTEGVDFSDDSAVEDFARTVWEAFMNANGEENNDTTKEQGIRNGAEYSAESAVLRGGGVRVRVACRTNAQRDIDSLYESPAWGVIFSSRGIRR